MRKQSLLLFCIFVICSVPLFSQKTPLQFSGIITDTSTNKLSLVHVIISNRLKGTISDIDGNFSIPVYSDDTLLFSRLGYKAQCLIIPDTISRNEFTCNVQMEQQSYILPEVNAYPYPATWSQFKKEFLVLELPDDKIDLHLPEKIQKTGGENMQPSISLGSPISALYYRFSKEGKELRKYQEIKENEYKLMIVHSKYNAERIKEITGIASEEEFIKFMNFCRLNQDFIYKSSDYEIVLAITACYDEFKNTEH